MYVYTSVWNGTEGDKFVERGVWVGRIVLSSSREE